MLIEQKTTLSTYQIQIYLIAVTRIQVTSAHKPTKWNPPVYKQLKRQFNGFPCLMVH